MGASEIANELPLSKSRVYSHLSTLRLNGFLPDENGVYRLSWQFLRVGVPGRIISYSVSREKQVDELGDWTGERSDLVIEEEA